MRLESEQPTGPAERGSPTLSVDALARELRIAEDKGSEISWQLLEEIPDKNTRELVKEAYRRMARRAIELLQSQPVPTSGDVFRACARVAAQCVAESEKERDSCTPGGTSWLSASAKAHEAELIELRIMGLDGAPAMETFDMSDRVRREIAKRTKPEPPASPSSFDERLTKLAEMEEKAKLADEYARVLIDMREEGLFDAHMDTSQGFTIVGMESEDARDWLRRYEELRPSPPAIRAALGRSGEGSEVDARKFQPYVTTDGEAPSDLDDLLAAFAKLDYPDEEDCWTEPARRAQREVAAMRAELAILKARPDFVVRAPDGFDRFVKAALVLRGSAQDPAHFCAPQPEKVYEFDRAYLALEMRELTEDEARKLYEEATPRPFTDAEIACFIKRTVEGPQRAEPGEREAKSDREDATQLTWATRMAREKALEDAAAYVDGIADRYAAHCDKYPLHNDTKRAECETLRMAASQLRSLKSTPACPAPTDGRAEMSEREAKAIVETFLRHQRKLMADSATNETRDQAYHAIVVLSAILDKLCASPSASGETKGEVRE